MDQGQALLYGVLSLLPILLLDIFILFSIHHFLVNNNRSATEVWSNIQDILAVEPSEGMLEMAKTLLEGM